MNQPSSATRNSCKLCMPLGAVMVVKGIASAMPFLHGSQGCSTYIRRYMISHFRDPVDIASSNFSESSAVFGGGSNLLTGLRNIIAEYNPMLIGIATTCLAETIGDDVAGLLRGFEKELGPNGPIIVHISTPSYSGTHEEGFRRAVRAVVERVAIRSRHGLLPGNRINVFPAMFSPDDLRYLKDIFFDFGLKAAFLPDYSDTLDGRAWDDYELIPKGGIEVDKIKMFTAAKASITFGAATACLGASTAGAYLKDNFNVPAYFIGSPIGLRASDELFGLLKGLSSAEVPTRYDNERGRLVDAYVDGHKYVYGKKAVVYGEEDLVIGLTSFLSEIGITPVIVASGGKSGFLKSAIARVNLCAHEPDIFDNADFATITERARALKPDIIIGSSKGYGLAKELKVPLVRVGFPVHDRVGAARILTCGYKGALSLYDSVVNALLDFKQNSSSVGYGYL